MAVLLPGAVNLYWTHIATLACVYWVLIAGLNLLVGYAGQLAIGFVSLMTIGAYTAAILCETAGWPAFAGLGAAAVTGGLSGLAIGLPAIRLKTFYFAMATLGFATIVTQIALGWDDLTGGGVGLPGPAFPRPFDTPLGLYYLALGTGGLATYLLVNIARSHVGRGLVAIRDAEVAAEAAGVQIVSLKLKVFAFAGALAGVSGALFAARQSYITPDAFTFDLSILFFIAVLIGGRGRVIGPMVGTAILTLLPEVAAPLVSWATFAYGALLLAVSLLLPGGIASIIEKYLIRRPPATGIAAPRTEALDIVLEGRRTGAVLVLSGGSLSFGGVHALKGLELTVRPGEVHALIGPNGSGKTTALNVLSGFYKVGAGRLALDGIDITAAASADRAAMGIARTFQKPRVVGNLGVLENAMLGGYCRAEAGFLAVAAGLPRARRADAALRARALAALEVVGLRAVAGHRAEELQHTGQRLLEIARCLVMQPRLVLLDEPAAGLSHGELEHLRQIIEGMRAHGIGVMLVEHHADLVFSLSDHVTVLNLGSVLASGTPADIRASADVIEAYLGS